MAQEVQALTMVIRYACDEYRIKGKINIILKSRLKINSKEYR